MPRLRHGSLISLILLSLLLAVSGCRKSLAVVNVKDVDSVVHYPATGGVVVSASRNPDAKAICVAPPAQGAMNVEFNLKHDGKVNVFKYVEVETQNALALSKSLAKLYEQNERTLFLQFSLYRLCEAYANGMLDEETYAETMTLEAARLRQAADEADVRVSRAKEAQERAEGAKAAQVQIYQDGLTAVSAAEKALETARKGLTHASEGTTRPRAEKAEDIVKEAERKVEEAKQRLASPQWKQAEGAVQAARDAASAVAIAESEKKSLEGSFEYVSGLASAAQKQETELLSKSGNKAELRKHLSRKNYGILFREVLKTAETLSKQQVEIAKAEAEKAKIEAEAEKAKQAAEKAKAEAEKAKASEEAKEAAAKLEALQDKLVDAAVSRVNGCSDKCQSTEAGKAEGTETCAACLSQTRRSPR